MLKPYKCLFLIFSMKKEIKAIIFDVGGVLDIRYFGYFKKLDSIAARHNISPKKFHDYRLKYLEHATMGKLSAKEYKHKITHLLKIKSKRKFIREWDAAFSRIPKINKAVSKTIFKLRKNYIIGALTNVTEMADKQRVENNAYKHFHFSLKSYEEGMKKPHLKFYKLLIKKIKLPANQIVFIDDFKENLVPAKKLGIKTVLFNNHKRLVKDLRKLGVKI